MICFVIYGANILSVNISLIVLKKIYGILMIFVDFRENFPWFWLIFCYPDPDPFHWSGSGSGWPKWNGSIRIWIRNTDYYQPICTFKEGPNIATENSLKTTIGWLFFSKSKKHKASILATFKGSHPLRTLTYKSAPAPPLVMVAVVA